MEWLSGIASVLGIISFIYGLILFIKKYPHIIKKYLFLCIGVVLIAGAITIRFYPDGHLDVKITSPQDNAKIQMYVTIEGNTSRGLSKDEHLYIMVEYGEVWWPQNGEVIVGYSQTSEKYEFNTNARVGNEEDTNKSFNIRALLVDSAVHQYFQNWFQLNRSTQKWDGIPIVETTQKGTIEIKDSITVTRE